MHFSGEVDIREWTSKFGLDIIGVGALSKDFQALGMMELHPIANAYAHALGADRKTWRYFITSIVLSQRVVRCIYPKHAQLIARRAQFLRERGHEI